MVTGAARMQHAESRAAGLAVPLYELSGVGRSHGSGAGRVDALVDVDLVIRPGELVAITGAGGSGKTTLLELLGALDEPTTGVVRCMGYDLSRLRQAELSRLRREAIGFVFEQFNLIPTLTAQQNVEAAMASRPGAKRRRRAADLLETVGLPHQAGTLPCRLSGAEKQRVAIGRALANTPSALLADEPTGNLDPATGAEILALLQRLAAERRQTVVVVTQHSSVAAFAPRIVTLRDGRVLEDSGVP
jgi:putative ABC transport system ATP-binding protein